MASANDIQVGGTHYKAGIQHWDFVVARQLGYFEGQVSKYVTRWRRKNGKQDLEKAGHFLLKLIEVAEAGNATPVQTVRRWRDDDNFSISLDDYAVANELTEVERTLVNLVCCAWPQTEEIRHLLTAQGVLNGLIASLEKPEEPGRGYVDQG